MTGGNMICRNPGQPSCIVALQPDFGAQQIHLLSSACLLVVIGSEELVPPSLAVNVSGVSAATLSD